jgi:CDP-glucose 4,6-dehydratase
MGTVNVLEAVRHVKSVRVAVMVTSDKCYENRERAQGYQEHEPMGGHDPYSSSKGCAELATSAYRRAFFSSEDPAALGGASGGVGVV